MNDAFTDFSSWYNTHPLFTRTYITVSFLMAALTSLEILNPGYLYYTFSDAFVHLEVWRAVTCLVYQGSFSFNYIFKVLYTYFALSRVETELFKKETYADFLWLCIYLAGSMVVIASFLPLYMLADGFLLAMLYIWCKRRPFERIRLLFALEVKSGYLPWVFMGLTILTNKGKLYLLVVGLLLGHLYIVLKDILYQKYHRDYLPTPQFFKRLVYRHEPRNRSRGNQAFGGRGVRLQ